MLKGVTMYIFEELERLGYQDVMWKFNNVSKDDAAMLCDKLGISPEHREHLLTNWGKWEHIKPPTLKAVFQIAGIAHLYDEFVATVKTGLDAVAFSKRHKLKPHQDKNVRLHWAKVKDVSQQSQQ